MGTKCKPLSISEKINKVDGVLNIHYAKIFEEQCNPMRKLGDKILGQSDTGENVLKTCTYIRLANYTNSAHLCNKFSKIIIKKTELLSPTL